MTELDAVVVEAALPSIVPVASKNTVVVRNAYGPFDRRQGFDLFLVQGLGVPEKIDFGQPLGGALNLMNPNRHVREILEVVHGLSVFFAVQSGIRMKNR